MSVSEQINLILIFLVFVYFNRSINIHLTLYLHKEFITPLSFFQKRKGNDKAKGKQEKFFSSIHALC